MYKYYKKNEYNIMYHYFDSIIEYLNYLDNTPIANGFQNYDLSSEDTDYDWYKTNSLDEAKELIKYGYNENFDRIKGAGPDEIKETKNRVIRAINAQLGGVLEKK